MVGHRSVRTALAAVLAGALVAGLGACGEDSPPRAEASADASAEECRTQWQEVAQSVVGMDEDPNPSALGERWTTVIATVDYYQSADTPEDCQSAVETQLKTATALRQFSDKLRPYDMTYQLGQAKAAIDLYLHEPVPDPVRGENGKRVKPPSKAAVTSAMQVLADNAAQANVELAPGWEQTKSVDLTDVAALTKTMQDLDFLAQDSPHWRQCEEALQVVVAAIRAQEGLAGTPVS